MVATAGICAAVGVGVGIVAAGAVGAGLGAVAYQLKDGPKTAEGGFLASALGAVSGIAGIAMVGLKPVASVAAAGIEKATVTAGTKAAPAAQSAASTAAASADDAVELTRVGRWMSPEEHTATASTGQVQVGGSGTTHVSHPASQAAFERQAPPGSLYVEFDVPASTLRPGGAPGWAQIPSPEHALYGRLAEIKGEPLMSPVPACNIAIVASC